MIAVLVAAFILSGAAGLIYESIWSRYLGLFVGHSAYAQIIVLVIFLGGMSLGAHLAGRRTSKMRSPLIWYAVLEVVVGFMALAFHEAFVMATAAAYDSIFPSLSGASLTAIKWGIASLLILPQSILLGATFPLMSAGVIRLAGAEQAPGRILGLLYFANSLGAAAGVLLAGFVLIQRYGLDGTLLVAGFLNVIVGSMVFLIGRADERSRARRTVDAVAVPAESPSPPETAWVTPPLWRPLLLVSFGTAVASFIYEIAWIRMLSLVLGSATHSFEIMLSAFILGLALGAFWIRSRADRIPDPVQFLGRVQWAMGVLAVATLPLYVASFEWIGTIIRTLQPNENGYRAFQLVRYAIALVIMLPSTFCAGTTLPLITKILMRQGGERAIGTVYAVNTLGSIAGVILAGLLLMPVLGLKRLLVFGAVIDIAIGVWLLARFTVKREPRWRFARNSGGLALPIAGTAVLLVAVALLARFDLARLTSGVYRHGIIAREGSFPFYRDGRTATVSMRRGVDGFTTLATNGKPDASMEKAWMDTASPPDDERWQLTRDIATQILLPLVTLAHAPDAENMAVVGFGSGMSSHVLLGSPRARQVVTIEIEPEMIRAAKLFRPANARVFDDPRSLLVTDDAKTYFAAAGRRFDLILSEPSNPWVSGVSGLFTVEFYERLQSQLTEHGIFGQWLHLYELSDDLVTSVLAAIDSVFPAYEVFFTSGADILVVASRTRVPPPDWSVTELPGIAHDLRRVIPFRPEVFEALRLGGREALRPMLLAYGVANSDYFPILDLGAERMRFMRENATGYISLSEGRFDVVAALTERRAGFGSVGSTPTPEVDRAVALALGARLRAIRSLPENRQIARRDKVKSALFRLDQLDRSMASSRPPADWRAWMQSVVRVDEDLHGGTAGVIDSNFFRGLHAYAARAGAPAEVRAGIAFLEGIGAWDWPTVVVAAGTLIAAEDTGPWIPDPLLRDGTLVGHVRLGNIHGAKEVMREFARRTTEDHFREQVLASHIYAADSASRRPVEPE